MVRMTIGRVAFGFSSAGASGSSSGISRICERNVDIFMVATSIRDQRRASFETPALRAPQDDVLS